MKYKDKNESYYTNLRKDMLPFLGKGDRILEIGCGNGILLKYLKDSNLYNEVWGSEMNYTNNLVGIDKFLFGKIEDSMSDIPNNYFDTLVFNDVLEHLFDPYETILKIKDKLKDNGVIVASIPNIRHISILYMLIFKKDFKYQLGGIMDFTHVRFFTKKSIIRLFEENGFDIMTIEGISENPFFIKRFLTKIISFVFGSDIRNAQFAIKAKKRL